MINFDKVKQTDEAIYNLIVEEYNRQDNGIELIASENIPSEAVLQAQASYHTLKYAEGYPEARYYGGCRIIDKTEQFAIERVCRLFECKYANVQPHSGAQANMAVLFAMCKPGDTIMGMSLNSGGHLTHGAKPTFSAKHFKAVQYEVDKETYLLDYNAIREQAMQEKPRLLIVGASAYPRAIDFKKFREIVDDVNRELLRELSIEYSDRPESEWPLARTNYKKLYLNASNGKLGDAPVKNVASMSYDSEKEVANFDYTFRKDTELTGYMKLRMYVEARGHDDMDLFINVSSPSLYVFS